MTDKISIRRFEKDDAQIVADLICTTLAVSNSKDYPPEYIKENIESHSAQVIEDRANESHFYVAVDGDTIIGCGGIGRKIIETLEERAAEFGEQLDFDGEYDWGEQMGREVWE